MRFVLCMALAGTACGGDDGRDEKQSSDGDERGSMGDAGARADLDGGRSRSDAMSDGGSTNATTSDAGMGDSGMTSRDAFDIVLCTPRPADNACLACNKQNCCEPLATCAKHAQCETVLDCLSACDTQSCRTACITMYPSGYEAASAIPLCNKSKCADVCK